MGLIRQLWQSRAFQRFPPLAPPQRAVALIKINNAQLGIVIFLDGVKLSEHDPCFTSATFDATRSIHWGKENTLVIRVGSHPGVLPANVSEEVRDPQRFPRHGSCATVGMCRTSARSGHTYRPTAVSMLRREQRLPFAQFATERLSFGKNPPVCRPCMSIRSAVRRSISSRG